MLSPLKNNKPWREKKDPFRKRSKQIEKVLSRYWKGLMVSIFLRVHHSVHFLFIILLMYFTPWILPNNLVRWITSPLFLNKLSQHGSLNINIPHQLTVLQITSLGTTGTPKTKQAPHGGNGKGQSWPVYLLYCIIYNFKRYYCKDS